MYAGFHSEDHIFIMILVLYKHKYVQIIRSVNGK